MEKTYERMEEFITIFNVLTARDSTMPKADKVEIALKLMEMKQLDDIVDELSQWDWS